MGGSVNSTCPGVAVNDVVRSKIFPAISLKKPGEHIIVNFGQTPFVYDIDDMMRVSILCKIFRLCAIPAHLLNGK